MYISVTPGKVQTFVRRVDENDGIPINTVTPLFSVFFTEIIAKPIRIEFKSDPRLFVYTTQWSHKNVRVTCSDI
jgi:hypothetical protein